MRIRPLPDGHEVGAGCALRLDTEDWTGGSPTATPAGRRPAATSAPLRRGAIVRGTVATRSSASRGTRQGYHSDLRDVEESYAAFFVAEDDGRIVGTAGLTSHGSLERLYVLARRARKRRRVGSPSGGRGGGASAAATLQLEIWSDKRFTDAHRLYERHGARVVGERVHDDPDASHEWGLVLDLTRPC